MRRDPDVRSVVDDGRHKMIVAMLLKVDFGALHRVAKPWRDIAVTVGINWLVKPFSMALFDWPAVPTLAAFGAHRTATSPG
jgi:ACR3 family arsenite efflux pump ArsB